ncbi:hypothetical protein ANN_18227 [Periplaneta americana]|uniref:Uncharacterized protein n=1 Tax=Periplaneta americana TaxID=6978 RepID=A0ABQ8SN58_PERAM|nr:hypothetical protein ANN_18227 [Periplaneta americana]
MRKRVVNEKLYYSPLLRTSIHFSEDCVPKLCMNRGTLSSCGYWTTRKNRVSRNSHTRSTSCESWIKMETEMLVTKFRSESFEKNNYATLYNTEYLSFSFKAFEYASFTLLLSYTTCPAHCSLLEFTDFVIITLQAASRDYWLSRPASVECSYATLDGFCNGTRGGPTRGRSFLSDQQGEVAEAGMTYRMTVALFVSPFLVPGPGIGNLCDGRSISGQKIAPRQCVVNISWWRLIVWTIAISPGGAGSSNKSADEARSGRPVIAATPPNVRGLIKTAITHPQSRLRTVFHLFGPMKKFLRRQRFSSDEEVKSVMRRWLRMKKWCHDGNRKT